jgi:hypothetical protein
MAGKKKVLTTLPRKQVSAKTAKQVRGGRKAGEGQKDFLK